MDRKHLALAPLLLVTVIGTFYFFSCYYSPRIPREIVPPSRSTFSTIVAFQEDEQSDCQTPISGFRHAVKEVQGWSRVHPESGWYVHSAYVDNRQAVPLVRIVAMSNGNSDRRLYCHWWLETGTAKSVLAHKQELWIPAWDSAKRGQYYHPFILSCPVPRIGHIVAVSIVREACNQPLNRIQLVHPENFTGNFVVCLKPLNFEEDISLRLLEWLELQYILGADHVYAYVYKLHPKTWEILQHYKTLGKVTWQNHTLPGNTSRNTELWQKRRHEMAMYNDCFYRHVHSYRFVVNLDLDEIIVPVISDSWLELLADHHPLSASMSVRNVYFFDCFGEADNPDIPAHMHMLRHVVRSANFTPPGFAQKSFFSTQLAEVVSNHFALKAITHNVRLLAGLDINRVHLHHYRKDCPPLMETDCKNNYMKFYERDTLLWKFKDRLIKNMLYRMQELGIEGALQTNSRLEKQRRKPT